VLVEFSKLRGASVSSFCTGVIYDTDDKNIYLMLNWHSVNKLKGNNIMTISQPQVKAEYRH